LKYFQKNYREENFVAGYFGVFGNNGLIQPVQAGNLPRTGLKQMPFLMREGSRLNF
jgi:hypothetical protein